MFSDQPPVCLEDLLRLSVEDETRFCAMLAEDFQEIITGSLEPMSLGLGFLGLGSHGCDWLHPSIMLDAEYTQINMHAKVCHNTHFYVWIGLHLVQHCPRHAVFL